MKCYQERAFTFSHSTWALKRVRPTSRASSAVTPGDRPSSPRDVPRWARQQLLSHVREANFNLAKAALLVSLEETAATQSFSQDATLFQLWCEDISERRAFTRAVGIESTWSLERFESLADEVTNFLYNRSNGDLNTRQPGDVPPLLSRPVRVQLGDGAQPSLPPRIASDLSSGACEAAADAVVAARKHALRKLQARLARSATDTDQNGSDIPSTTEPAQYKGSTEFPFAFTAAVASVLYQRHGYQRMESHGNPLSSHLNAVMEDGAGTPLLMAILYQEVASRAGLPLNFLLLDGNQYCLLWPQHDGCSPSLLIDPYHNGDLLASEEVRELFQLSEHDSEAFVPATAHELLDALLGSLQAAHWSAAAGCPPEPALRTPLLPATALVRGKRRLAPFAMQRAVAAAERRCALMPTWSTHLELAVLLHLASKYKRALQELIFCSETVPSEEAGSTTAQQLTVLMEKTRVQLAIDI